MTGNPKKLNLVVPKPKTAFKVPRDSRVYDKRPSCVLERFITRKFLKQNNLRLIDLRCKLSQISRNCGVSSYLAYRCREGYVFANRKASTVSTCQLNGQWSNIPACISSIHINNLTFYNSIGLIY